ncbi:MAG: tRNA (adenosine(37)-N6)-dimethylallyltransferase MiaA [Victivallales bacterium]|nr:tRNA (adenosine(37)-N6)-dimethylallyltransferase MiaA [Victivallales bacterium]
MSKVPVILGPTCAWKSASALAVARELRGEIISCDSMQVYRGLTIGTAQPSQEELAAVPHHLVACMDMEERWDANRFVPAANQLIDEIQSRGNLPVIAGGTGLYARALCYGFSMLPGDSEIAARLRETITSPEGVESLRRELKDNFTDIPEQVLLNPRRLARSVEVFRICGKASWLMNEGHKTPSPRFRQFCIIPDIAMLRERIFRRCEIMLKAGWIQECREAVEKGLLQTVTAWQALGYREMDAFFREGARGGEKALTELLATKTVQFARRQLTWFRHQHPGAVLIDVDREEGALEKITGTILSAMKEEQ